MACKVAAAPRRALDFGSSRFGHSVAGLSLRAPRRKSPGGRANPEHPEEMMRLDSHGGVMKVGEVLQERGFTPQVVELDRSARSAADAAEALGWGSPRSSSRCSAAGPTDRETGATSVGGRRKPRRPREDFRPPLRTSRDGRRRLRRREVRLRHRRASASGTRRAAPDDRGGGPVGGGGLVLLRAHARGLRDGADRTGSAHRRVVSVR